MSDVWVGVLCRSQDHIWPDPNPNAMNFFPFTSGGNNSGLLKESEVLLVVKTILYPKAEAYFISDLIYPFNNTEIRSKKDYFIQYIINWCHRNVQRLMR